MMVPKIAPIIIPRGPAIIPINIPVIEAYSEWKYTEEIIMMRNNNAGTINAAYIFDLFV